MISIKTAVLRPLFLYSRILFEGQFPLDHKDDSNMRKHQTEERIVNRKNMFPIKSSLEKSSFTSLLKAKCLFQLKAKNGSPHF